MQMPPWRCDVLDMKKTVAYTAVTVCLVIAVAYFVFVLSNSLSPPNQIAITIASLSIVTLTLAVFEQKYWKKIELKKRKKRDIEHELKEMQ